MAGATEIRRSPPFAVADDAIELHLEVVPPLRLVGDTVDASRLGDSEPAEIRLRATIDWQAVQQAAGSEGPFEVLVISRCRATRWSSSSRMESDEPGEYQERFSGLLRLDRRDIRGSAGCGVQVVLPARRDDASPMLAQAAGSVVSRRSFTVRFDRGGFEFPTQWVSFRANNYPEHALWLLHIGGEGWTGEPQDTVEIRLNDDNTAFQRLLQSPRREDLRAAETLYRQIAYDCLATLVSEYLLGDGVDEAVSEGGTRLCDVLARLIERGFDEDVGELKSLARESPARLRLRVQHAISLGKALS